MKLEVILSWNILSLGFHERFVFLCFQDFVRVSRGRSEEGDVLFSDIKGSVKYVKD